ncbi:Ribonuclease H-like protein [Brazilian cedratvirus IHUMI]|uniref:Ribonuclease H-like protein n=1 Tax=Brazilian cedratvirus IHUMI TaxID=2126980 RepID=A0A2R8FEJ5_9VIRU|nr:Ribonuclease H-like protein [Brazilian cedratvirus IHUMI]
MQHLVLDEEVDVYYLCDVEEAEDIFSQVLTSRPRMVGLSTETTTGQEKESLLQICVEGVVYIYPLLHLPCPVSLKKILSSSNIIKSGVGLDEQASSLCKNYSLKLQGVLDLEKVALAMGYPGSSLLYLAKHHNLPLGNMEKVKKDMYKVAWHKQLSSSHLEYAAREAWLSCALVEKMLVKV